MSICLFVFTAWKMVSEVLELTRRWGEIMDINMPRDKETGKPRGFAFIMYEDQRSTVLAVDNMNGALVLGRMLKVRFLYNRIAVRQDWRNREAVRLWDRS